MVEVIGYDELTGYPICKGDPDGTTYEQGREDAINKCVDILARLVMMELLNPNDYEMVKAELEDYKNE